jgi:hypothetical protein
MTANPQLRKRHSALADSAPGSAISADLVAEDGGPSCTISYRPLAARCDRMRGVDDDASAGTRISVPERAIWAGAGLDSSRAIEGP